MKNNTEKIRENGIRESWGENETDVEENYVGKKGVREIRLISLDLSLFAVGERLSSSLCACYICSRYLLFKMGRTPRQTESEEEKSRKKRKPKSTSFGFWLLRQVLPSEKD